MNALGKGEWMLSLLLFSLLVVFSQIPSISIAATQQAIPDDIREAATGILHHLNKNGAEHIGGPFKLKDFTIAAFGEGKKRLFSFSYENRFGCFRFRISYAILEENSTPNYALNIINKDYSINCAGLSAYLEQREPTAILYRNEKEAIPIFIFSNVKLQNNIRRISFATFNNKPFWDLQQPKDYYTFFPDNKGPSLSEDYNKMLISSVGFTTATRDCEALVIARKRNIDFERIKPFLKNEHLKKDNVIVLDREDVFLRAGVYDLKTLNPTHCASMQGSRALSLATIESMPTYDKCHLMLIPTVKANMRLLHASEIQTNIDPATVTKISKEFLQLRYLSLPIESINKDEDGIQVIYSGGAARFTKTDAGWRIMPESIEIRVYE